MKLYSTWYYDENEEKVRSLSIDAVTPQLKKAESVQIVSAYYGLAFLKKFFGKVNKTKRKKCIVKLIFNGLSGQRLYEQIKDLKSLKKSLLRSGFSQIDIFLNKETSLLHTKLYYIKNDSGSIWYAGSANASMSAFERNEEILLESKSNINNIKRYLSYIIDDSIHIEDIDVTDIAESNLIGFFRTGSIYFKPTNQISFTFSELKLTEEIEEKISTLSERPRNTNPGKAWGAYNLKLAIGLDSNESQEENKDDEKNVKLSLKPWAIETCYGYWVPNKYRKYVNEKIDLKSAHNESKYLKILQSIKNIGNETIIDDYQQYIEDAKTILKSNNINFEINMNDLIEKFRKFLDRIIKKIDDPKKLERLCKPLISTGMPEIWEDNLSFDEFSESYFEYISSCLNEERLPTIIRSIKNKIEINKKDDEELISEAFISYFDDEEAEWSDEDWLEQ